MATEAVRYEYNAWAVRIAWRCSGEGGFLAGRYWNQTTPQPQFGGVKQQLFWTRREARQLIPSTDSYVATPVRVRVTVEEVRE